MQSQQTNLDVIANNLANVNTTGFKRNKAEFQDLLYQTTRASGSDQGGGATVPTAAQVGHGSRLVSTSKIFTTGELSETGEKWNVAINGDGFFEVVLNDQSRGFTRDGSFKVGSDGTVQTSDGLKVVGGFPTVPAGTTDVTISNTGVVTTNGSAGRQTATLSIVRFANPGGLESIGRNLYKMTNSSGTAEAGQPGLNGYGELQQNWLELSNVKVVEEMVNMILAQRAYEVNSKAVQAADEMMQISNNLRRG